jgi:non-specific serine/threonine protein kinase/serine/threonine-protein kinase
MSQSGPDRETEYASPTQPTPTHGLDPDQRSRLLSAFGELNSNPVQIDRFSIVSRIGEGGMGEVYKAEQREPIRRTVALKVIKLGMDTRDVIARFNSERQTLALMTHPCIAQVYDAGATDTGRPYFVMEYVAGEPITAYCDRNHLPIKRRLELFVEVCGAVEHAHQKGIIHRDLKPSNILVCVRDDRAVPKVIDFGVAKAVHRGMAENTLQTTAGVPVGTFEYMSPEQAGVTSLDVDTRSDVYSLGVVMYELLSGSLPIDPQTMRCASLNEMQRMVSEVPAPRPSGKLSGLGARANEIAMRRSTRRDDLIRELRRELEWVPLKAMRKDRVERYRSATELADDVKNYLNGRPLLAGPESVSYLARKFIGRHRKGLVAAAIIVLLFVGGIITYVRGIKREQRLTAAALGEVQARKKEAETRQAESEAVVNFFNQSILGNATPESIPERSVRDTIVRTMLDPAAKAVRRSFQDHPTVQAAVMNQIALAYDKLGRLRDAEPLYGAALDNCRRALGEDDPKTLTLANNYAGILMQLGRPADAIALCHDTMLRRQRVLGPDDPATLLSMDNYARLLAGQDRAGEGEPIVREVLDRRTKLLGETHPDTIRTMMVYAEILDGLGRGLEAEPFVREAYERRRRALGDDHPDTLEAENAYARMLRKLKRLEQAEPLARDALERRRRILGSDHRDTLISMNTYALILTDMGRLPEAESIYREVLEQRRHLFGENHTDTLVALHNYATHLNTMGRPAEAEPLEREALSRAVASPRLGAGSAVAQRMAMRLCEILVALGRTADADEVRRQYLASTQPATQPTTSANASSNPGG